MKIIHVMLWYIPKMGYQENFLPAEQKKLGYDVEIITSDRVPSYNGYKDHIGNIIGDRIIGTGVFEENGVTIHRLSTRFEIKNGGQLILNDLKKKLKELKPDIVQAHGVFTLLTLQLIYYSKKQGYKIFVDDHLHERNFHLDSLAKKTYVEIVKGFYRVYGNRVSYWMPVTDSSKQILQSLIDIPEDKIDLLYLGVDANRFKNSVELRKIGRNENNINNGTISIISTGKFDECKDIHILIKAFEKIAKEYPKTKLLLIGNGPEEYMNKLKDLVNSTNLVGNVLFKNFVLNSELPKYYNAADIGVWPGDHSITVIEAIATGLPVIVPVDDLAYKVLFKNNAAMGYERRNVESLSNALLKLIKTQKLRSELSDNSTALATEILSWERIAEKSISIYLSRKDEC